MHIALGGHDEENPDDPFWLVPPIADVPRFSPLSQERLEDLQLFAFLAAVSAAGGTHPISIRIPASDPPDRVLAAKDREYGLELTELTLQDLRADLGPLRAFGRTLQQQLEASGDHEHLRGRLINVGPVGAEPPKDPIASLQPIVDALKEDKGSLADVPIDMSQGMPQQLPDTGFYGNVGEFNVHLNAGPGVDGHIVVSASGQGEIRRSQALEGIQARVRAKDRPENEILLITCGLPDKRGYICGVDQWIFHMLHQAAATERLVTAIPTHLSGVVLHDFASGQWFEVFGRDGFAAPWSA